jgi:ribonuclease R
MLRSLKQAVYSEKEEGHYALASTCYCHFTSPIRRYPDLTIHRQLTRWKRTGKAAYDETELMFLGEHCSGMERRAALAERDLVKVKLLEFMSKQLGEHKMAIITGVAEYGFFAQIVDLPVEGMVHITTLNDDNYLFDAESHSLTGLKYKRRFRLGDKIEVEIAKVDIVKKQMDLRPVIAMEEQKKKPNRK